MGHDVEIACRCGNVHGWVRGASPRTVSHVVCYCDDCQVYVHHLGRVDLLDEHGGTDLVQVSPSSLTFDRGTDRIAGLRLGPKGLFRWYASCCKTPLGNTTTPSLPFVGITHGAFPGIDASRRDELFGAPWRVQGKFAVGGPPEGATVSNVRGGARAARLVLGGKLRGKGWPNPFFDRTTGERRYPVSVLSKAERDALRTLAGPRPAHPTA
ncbi:MAG TPA: DUF6151 family protein [Labilithrix sp.]|nr:DUF6151 family protein [Labilithrix sp.]